MGMWTRDLNRTTAEDIEDYSQPAQGGIIKMWLAGLVIAGVVVGYGLWSAFSGETILPARHASNVKVMGAPAAILGIAYAALGLFLHFHYFWGLNERLHRYSQPLKIVSLVVFIPCFLYGAVTATNLFTIFQ